MENHEYRVNQQTPIPNDLLRSLDYLYLISLIDLPYQLRYKRKTWNRGNVPFQVLAKKNL